MALGLVLLAAKLLALLVSTLEIMQEELLGRLQASTCWETLELA